MFTSRQHEAQSVIAVRDGAGQTLLNGMGELHLDVAAERLRREYGVPVRVGKVRVAYRETVKMEVDHQVRPPTRMTSHPGPSIIGRVTQ